MPRALWTSVVATGLGAGVLMGCGSSIDVSQVEETIVAEFAGQGVPLTGTSCETVKAEVGAPVRCTARNPKDTVLVIEGEVTAIDDDRGSFRVTATRGEAEGTAIADEAKRLLEAEVGQRATAMACPSPVEIPTSAPVRCTLTVAGNVRYGVDVTVDAAGKLAAEVDDEPIS